MLTLECPCCGVLADETELAPGGEAHLTRLGPDGSDEAFESHLFDRAFPEGVYWLLEPVSDGRDDLPQDKAVARLAFAQLGDERGDREKGEEAQHDYRARRLDVFLEPLPEALHPAMMARWRPMDKMGNARC